MSESSYIQLDQSYKRLISFLEIACKKYYKSGRGVPFTIQWLNCEPHQFGEGKPEFAITLKDEKGVSMVATLDGTSFLEAYVFNHMDFYGSMEKMFTFRDITTDNHLFTYFWNLIKPFIFGQVKSDRSAISSHYNFSQEFYLAFLDSKYRCYSQGIFNNEDESLEKAVTHKLDFVFESIDVKPGDKVLDIGGGWGAFTEFAGKKGVNVTSITISEESYDYLKKLIERKKLPCEVVNCHLYQYFSASKFDAIVNLGVTEHLPDYKRSLEVYLRLLKPGGRVYLDASATRRKYHFHKFIYKYIYPGNCSPMCLHDYLGKLAKTPFNLLGIWDDRYSYYLTAKHWAQNLEKNKDAAIALCNKTIFRMFQVYLWGTADVFKRDIMQAYRILFQLPEKVELSKD